MKEINTAHVVKLLGVVSQVSQQQFKRTDVSYFPTALRNSGFWMEGMKHYHRLAILDTTCTVKSVKSIIHSCCSSDCVITYTVNHGIIKFDNVIVIST